MQRFIWVVLVLVAASLTLTPASWSDETGGEAESWTTDFPLEKDELASSGRNPYFILEPGYQLTLEDDAERLVITVLNETKKVDGVETRIVEVLQRMHCAHVAYLDIRSTHVRVKSWWRAAAYPSPVEPRSPPAWH